jgi:hypothetical protein
VVVVVCIGESTTYEGAIEYCVLAVSIFSAGSLTWAGCGVGDLTCWISVGSTAKCGIIAIVSLDGHCSSISCGEY